MNADLKAMMAADLAYAISDIPYTCVYKAITFTATIGDLRRMNEVAPEGILFEHDLEIYAPVSVFAAEIPDVQEIITVDGVKYHIAMRSIDPAKVGVTFGLRRI